MTTGTIDRDAKEIAAFLEASIQGHAGAMPVAVQPHLTVPEIRTLIASLRELEKVKEAAGRLVSEFDDDAEHGLHAYEQECPLCCAIEDVRAITSPAEKGEATEGAFGITPRSQSLSAAKENETP